MGVDVRWHGVAAILTRTDVAEDNIEPLASVTFSEIQTIATQADLKTAKYARDRWTVVKEKLTSSAENGKNTQLNEKDAALLGAVLAGHKVRPSGKVSYVVL